MLGWRSARTADDSRQPLPQLSPVAADIFKGLDAGLLHPDLPVSGVDWATTMTHSYVDAPALPGRRPVLLYSPGGTDPRTIGTSLAEDLASDGYVVVTIDHPGETSEVDFALGRPSCHTAAAYGVRNSPTPTTGSSPTTPP
ncbi:hypothetical protein F1D05_08035 [Kribbella qitaiheensis]|uniref:Alpha/beta hydrolase n=1 Tax=Kribbella qitaiheensis TaxID=1544730 RepID=A0A7G6X9B0_9ACTN|nr:hypothetical protein F1D05_08035 [Kribbella qitaiheensis]